MRHLKAFQVFNVAASVGSYSEAAKQLNITHGAVSKQIKVLEEHLACSLFYKQGRGVRLTSEGELLKGYTERAFSTLQTGVNVLSRQNNNVLEVSCEPTLTMRWLMPRISEFFAKSGIDVRLSTAGGPVTLGASGLSLAIRRDDFEAGTDYQKLFLVEEWVGPVFSSQYWEEISRKNTDVTCLHSETRPEAWKNWLSYFDIANSAQKQPERNQCLNQFKSALNTSTKNHTMGHFYFCLQAAVDGLGGAIGSYPLIQDDLSRGNLIAPFGFVKSGFNYVLLAEQDKLTHNEEQFSDWLKAELAKSVPQ
jgi:DNA-binding transcriptional LysR family regulator